MNQKALIATATLVALAPALVYIIDPNIVFAVNAHGLKALLVAILITVAALGYGTLLLARDESNTSNDNYFLMIATGLGIESALMMIAGFAGFVTLLTALIIVAGGLLPAVAYLRRNIGELKIPDTFKLDIPAISVICVAAFAILLTLPTSLTPPLFYDGLVYHLALPKYYILEGRITHAPFNFFSFFPQAIEMLYLIALMLGGETAPKALTWLFAIICFWGVHNTASEIGGPRAGLWSVLIMLGMPWAIICSQIVYIEPVVAIFLIAAFLMTLRINEWNLNETAAAAILIGIAAATKYNAMPLAGLIGIYTIIRLGTARSWSKIGAYMLVASAVAAPWYIRNLLVASNPVAPFYFGSKFWTAEQVSRYADALGKYGLGNAPIHKKIFAPLLAFVAPKYFPQAIGAGLAPLFAAMFIPFAKIRRDVLLPVLIFLSGAIMWTFTSQQTRFLLVSEVFLIVAGAVALAELEMHKIIKNVACTVLVLASLISLTEGVGSINVSFKSWEGILLRQNTDAFIAKRVPTYLAMRKISDLPPTAGTTLIVGETRTYYLNRPFIPITAWDINPLVEITAACPDTNCIKKKLKHQGIGIIIRGTSEEKRLIDNYRFLAPIPKEKRNLYYEFFDTLTIYGKGKSFIVYQL